MTKIAILATAALVAIASPASAGLTNNGLNPNGLSANGLSARDVPPDPYAQCGGDAVTASVPKAGFCANLTSLSLGALEGMKVMTIELPR